MPVSAKDVAAACSISLTTVNEILGGRGERYRATTRELVRATAERLGYRRHGMAMAVRTGRFRAVALVNASDETDPQLRPDLVWGIADRLAQAGHLLQFARLPDAALADADAPRLLDEWCSDGLLINAHHPIAERFVERIRGHRIPAIWLNSDDAQDAVRPDDAGAPEIAVAHLQARGHTRIAWLDPVRGSRGPAGHHSHEQRRAGYRQAMRQRRLTPCLIEEAGAVPEAGHPALARRLDAHPLRPTACITPDRNLAASILHVCHPAPEIVVLDDAPVTVLGRRLTTCLVPQRRMGTTAVELLLARIAGAPPGPAAIIPFTLHPESA